MDRNNLSDIDDKFGGVALRKESVDRNCRNRFCPTCQWRSLSARRAWIEILVPARQVCLICVALRKESVDRNLILPLSGVLCGLSLSARRAWIEIQAEHQLADHNESLSARRAWIEILDTLVTTHADLVALRKESVDRNIEILVKSQRNNRSLSARRAWIEIDNQSL